MPYDGGGLYRMMKGVYAVWRRGSMPYDGGGVCHIMKGAVPYDGGVYAMS